MKRLPRLTHILLKLQANRLITAQDLSDQFGVSVRTIYRDIQTLCEAGVPVVGEAGSGYSLMSHYRLSPVSFTEEEIAALVIARALVMACTDEHSALHLNSLVDKIKAVSRYPLQIVADDLSAAMKVPKKNHLQHLSQLQKAILKRQVLEIEYRALYNDLNTCRSISPLALYYAHSSGQWVLIAICHLRNEVREFRTDRIMSLVKTQETFTPPSFSIDIYLKERCARLHHS